MTIVLDTILPPCAQEPEVFQDDRLHHPPARHEVSAEVWNGVVAAQAAAHRRCAACPVMVECLYRAVVKVDVSGFAACTTEEDRDAIRSQLGVEVPQAALTAYGAARVGGGPISHEAVVTLRQAYPRETCQQLAERLGCSTSTIKRHLRRDREERALGVVKAEKSKTALPTVDEVLDAFDDLEASKVA